MNRDFDGLITFSSAKNAAFSILPFTCEIVKVFVVRFDVVKPSLNVR